MSKEAKILKTGISYYGTLLPKTKQMKGVMYLRCVGLTKTDS